MSMVECVADYVSWRSLVLPSEYFLLAPTNPLAVLDDDDRRHLHRVANAVFAHLPGESAPRLVDHDPRAIFIADVTFEQPATIRLGGVGKGGGGGEAEARGKGSMGSVGRHGAASVFFLLPPTVRLFLRVCLRGEPMSHGRWVPEWGGSDARGVALTEVWAMSQDIPPDGIFTAEGGGVRLPLRHIHRAARDDAEGRTIHATLRKLTKTLNPLAVEYPMDVLEVEGGADQDVVGTLRLRLREGDVDAFVTWMNTKGDAAATTATAPETSAMPARSVPNAGVDYASVTCRIVEWMTDCGRRSMEPLRENECKHEVDNDVDIEKSTPCDAPRPTAEPAPSAPAAAVVAPPVRVGRPTPQGPKGAKGQKAGKVGTKKGTAAKEVNKKCRKASAKEKESEGMRLRSLHEAEEVVLTPTEADKIFSVAPPKKRSRIEPHTQTKETGGGGGAAEGADCDDGAAAGGPLRGVSPKNKKAPIDSDLDASVLWVCCPAEPPGEWSLVPPVLRRVASLIEERGPSWATLIT